MTRLTKINVLDLLREPFYWNIYNADKENKQEEVWRLFEDYNSLFKNQPGSEWHSKMLTSAVFRMHEKDQWRFLPFFQNWNPETLLEQDWKEEKKGDKVFKPLGIKALNKICDIVKLGKNVESLSTFLKVYDVAISKYPKDIWLKREKAILLIKSGNQEEAIKIYKKLVFALGDQAYIWHEFSKCMDDDQPLISIGMLCKAISIQKNEDFLGEIHIELAQLLINENLLEQAGFELELYKQNKDSNGWKLSETYNKLFQKVKDVKIGRKDRNSFYTERRKVAEEFAYEDVQWTELILIDKWRNDNNKEKLSFYDGKAIKFSISLSRLPELRNASLGQIICFKIHKEGINNKEDKVGFYFSAPPVEYNFIPLMVQQSAKPRWSILPEIYAVVDYVNSERKVIHAITLDNKKVFFPDDKMFFKNGDFIKAYLFEKKIKNEIRYELKGVIKTDSRIALEKLPNTLAIVDSVNNDKKLFHFVVNCSVHGIVRFDETQLRPNEGDFIHIKYVQKHDKKHNKIIFKPLEIWQTEETSMELRKEICGPLTLKFKKDEKTIDFDDFDFSLESHILPDFGFVDGFYVPKHVLEKNYIAQNGKVSGSALFNGKKWQVFKLTLD